MSIENFIASLEAQRAVLARDYDKASSGRKARITVSLRKIDEAIIKAGLERTRTPL